MKKYRTKKQWILPKNFLWKNRRILNKDIKRKYNEYYSQKRKKCLRNIICRINEILKYYCSFSF